MSKTNPYEGGEPYVFKGTTDAEIRAEDAHLQKLHDANLERQRVQRHEQSMRDIRDGTYLRKHREENHPGEKYHPWVEYILAGIAGFFPKR